MSESEMDYKALEGVLFAEALGDSEAVVESETLVRKTDDGEIRQTRTYRRPSAAIAARLLDARVGGPQDFC